MFSDRCHSHSFKNSFYTLTRVRIKIVEYLLQIIHSRARSKVRILWLINRTSTHSESERPTEQFQLCHMQTGALCLSWRQPDSRVQPMRQSRLVKLQKVQLILSVKQSFRYFSSIQMPFLKFRQRWASIFFVEFQRLRRERTLGSFSWKYLKKGAHTPS